MSEELAISLRGVSKCFKRYDRPVDRLKELLIPGKSRAQEFWALRDIDLDVPKGQTLGIVGRNGSGKSTLLQIIAGTLTPTTGTVQVNGRVSALLELGSGFNPEFTGRQNIFFNAQVLGLTKSEIENKFDQIASFADIGEFLEQPVKTYSSGMYVRLAFAVASHVDADIIIVDEALAVGDAIFTQKCMRFMRNFQESGTLIFVSHDLSSVQNLCEAGIWLHDGKIQVKDAAKLTAEAYLKYSYQEINGDSVSLKDIKTLNTSKNSDIQDNDNFNCDHKELEVDQSPKLNRSPKDISNVPRSPLDYGSSLKFQNNLDNARGWATGCAEITHITFYSIEDPEKAIFAGGEKVCLEIFATTKEFLQQPILGFLFKDKLGQDLFGENTLSFTSVKPLSLNPGQQIVGSFIFRLPMLPNGQYVIMASIADGTLESHIQHHWLHDALIVNVSSSKVRWGLVGLAFEDINLVCKDNH